MKQNNFKEALHNQFKVGYHKGYNKGFTDAVPFAIKNYSSVLLICLKDKFDFTPEQLTEVAIQIDKQFDAINEGRLSFDDILTVLREEDHIEVNYGFGIDLASGPDQTGGL